MEIEGTLIYATVCNFRWRLVIHGGIDGFSRMIVFLKCSTNNLASTVLDCFVEAVGSFGLPSRVRSDKGGVNVDVARYMLSHPLRGPDRGSHIAGRRVHNNFVALVLKISVGDFGGRTKYISTENLSF